MALRDAHALIGAITFWLLLGQGCSSKTSSTVQAESCKPGEAVECIPVSGCRGRKACKPDGKGFGECLCYDGGAGVGGVTGSSGSSGSGGVSGSNTGGAGGGSGGVSGAGAGGVPDAGPDASVGGTSGDAGAATGGTNGGGSGGSGGSAGEVCVGADNGGADFARWPIPNPPGAGLPNPRSYTFRTTTVRDDVTKLEWQRASSPSTLNHAGAIAYCRDLVIDGCTDWRLPTWIELVSLLNLTRVMPSIDVVAFPSTPAEPFWSATPLTSLAPGAPDQIWTAYFLSGDLNTQSATGSGRARCVRDNVPRTTARYTIGADVVDDLLTGLKWQRSPPLGAQTHAAALAYCAALTLGGFDDWRMPTRLELQSIVDVRTYDPAIDAAVFSPTQHNFFWSSSVEPSSTRPWFVTFREGGITFADLIPDAAVRCVR